MKNILTILILLFTQTINAQKVKTFFEIGINHGHVKEKIFYKSEGKTNYYKPGIGLNLGLKLVTNIDENFDFKMGFYLSKFNYQTIHRAILFNSGIEEYSNSGNVYFNIPLLLSYKINNNIALNIGTGINLNVLNIIDKQFYKYGIPLNLGFTIRIKRTALDFMYSIGNMTFNNYHNYYLDFQTKQYSTFFHRQLSINIGRCLNRKSKTKWD